MLIGKFESKWRPQQEPFTFEEKVHKNKLDLIEAQGRKGEKRKHVQTNNELIKQCKKKKERNVQMLLI